MEDVRAALAAWREAKERLEDEGKAAGQRREGGRGSRGWGRGWWWWGEGLFILFRIYHFYNSKPLGDEGKAAGGAGEKRGREGLFVVVLFRLFLMSRTLDTYNVVRGI
jgi:hypothetical protein